MRTRRSTVLSHVNAELETNHEADNNAKIQQVKGAQDHADTDFQGPPEAVEPDLLSTPPEIAQEVWESLKEEFYEPIEQLPLSLHRSFTLIGEQDREAQSSQNELLPTIRSYIKLRQSLEQEQDNDIRSKTAYRGAEVNHTQHNRINVEARSNSPPANFNQANNTARDPATSHIVRSTPQSSPMRAQGGRETDATVPKSVPFPPRARPKTIGELLTRITFLTSELLRASDEKVGLATVAYDLIDRHVKILDTAVKEHEGSVVLGLREGTRPVETTLQVESATALTEEVEEVGEVEEVEEGAEEDEDEEPQLGMIGPAVGTGVEGKAGQRLRKNRRKDKRKHDMDGQALLEAAVTSVDAPQELSIDPDEPRYCYCNQVSYGEMIACDNPDCNREWFHLGCAGLTAPPKGRVKWFCRDCEEETTKVKKRRVH
ncbi:hypothetical protein BU17DRAFT_44769 [Hysterangium stoloniferum]|nr:hypothetical protein BU17DRAFT_44769 [Hysterangium stoloniferum]